MKRGPGCVLYRIPISDAWLETTSRWSLSKWNPRMMLRGCHRPFLGSKLQLTRQTSKQKYFRCTYGGYFHSRKSNNSVLVKLLAIFILPNYLVCSTYNCLLFNSKLFIRSTCDSSDAWEIDNCLCIVTALFVFHANCLNPKSQAGAD